MSFQTSEMDTTFGLSGERILSSSIKGQIFEFRDIVYIVYTEFINQQYHIIVYQPTTQQKTILYSSSLYPVIRTLKLDTINPKIWFAGYIDKPMNGFYTSSSISTSNVFSPITSLNILNNTKTIESLTIVNGTTILFSAISPNNECWIMSSASSNIYQIHTSLKSFSVKDIYFQSRVYHVLIEGISNTSNKSVVEMYKIPGNTLNGSF
jgi:hypothetical protein